MNLHTSLDLEQKTTKMIPKIPPKYSIAKDGHQMVSINFNFIINIKTSIKMMFLITFS